MKVNWTKICFVTAAIVVCTTLASESIAQLLPDYPDFRLKRMPYRNCRGEDAVTIFYYGRDGKLRNAVWTLADRSRYSANFHLYDGDGYEMEKYREFSDGLTSTERYEVDLGGRRTAEFFTRSDGRKGSAHFTWDADDRLVVTECDNHKGWLSGRIAYSYDETGKRDGASMERDGKTVGTVEYSYDSAGHVVEEVWDFDGQWTQAFSYEYEPCPRKIFGFSSPYVAMKSGYEQYSYDRVGRLEKAVYDNMDFWLNGEIHFKSLSFTTEGTAS